MKNIEISNLSGTDISYIFDSWVNKNVMLGQTALNKVSNRHELAELIDLWNAKTYGGKYFEVFKVVADGLIVGLITLYAIENETISIGCTIDKNFWRNGYGAKAVMLAIEKAKEYKYKYIKTQCLSTNYASIKLHEKCGLKIVERKENNKGNTCNFYEIQLI